MPAISVSIRTIVAFTLAWMAVTSHAHAQDDASRDDILSDTTWMEFRQARYTGEPILLHLKTGQERAVIWPEPIEFRNDSQSLPGCAVVINSDVVGFFPTTDFKRTRIQFKGLETGSIYELRVRATDNGMLEPLQISR